MMKFLKKRWYIVLIIVIVLSYFIIQRNNSTANGNDKISSYKVKKETLKTTLTLSGEIDAEEKATLRFQTSGRLAWVGVKEGDYVKKYQVIATLDQRDLNNRLTKYLNTYAIQRNTFEQAKDDNNVDKNDFSQSIRDEAKRVFENNQYSLNNTVLDVEYQNLTVEYSRLWSPVEGIVTSIATPFAGVNITPAGSEFEIVNPKTIFLSVTAEQSDVVLLKEGIECEVVFDAYPTKTHTGIVDYISYSPKTGETGTVYQVSLKLDEAAMELPLKMAMTGDAEFILNEKKDVLAVPIQYIKKDAKGDYIMRERKGKKEKIYVKRGDEFDTKIEIKNEIAVGDVIYD